MSVVKSQKFKTVMYVVLSFIMTLCILACSLLSTIKFTLLNPNFLIETLNKTDYYSDLSKEITEELVALGDASGLDKSFFNDFIDETQLKEDVEKFINAFYLGEDLKVDTSDFQKTLKAKLDIYIDKNGIEISDSVSDGINNFIKEANDIYSSGVTIKYFPQIQKIVSKFAPMVIMLVFFSALFAVAIALLIILTNKWKHIALRHIYYSTASSGLFLLLIPAVVFISGIISKLTVLTRSLNDMYSACLKTVFIAILVIAVLLILISVVLWILHNRLRKKASS